MGKSAVQQFGESDGGPHIVWTKLHTQTVTGSMVGGLPGQISSAELFKYERILVHIHGTADTTDMTSSVSIGDGGLFGCRLPSNGVVAFDVSNEAVAFYMNASRMEFLGPHDSNDYHCPDSVHLSCAGAFTLTREIYGGKFQY